MPRVKKFGGELVSLGTLTPTVAAPHLAPGTTISFDVDGSNAINSIPTSSSSNTPNTMPYYGQQNGMSPAYASMGFAPYPNPAGPPHGQASSTYPSSTPGTTFMNNQYPNPSNVPAPAPPAPQGPAPPPAPMYHHPQSVPSTNTIAHEYLVPFTVPRTAHRAAHHHQVAPYASSSAHAPMTSAPTVPRNQHPSNRRTRTARSQAAPHPPGTHYRPANAASYNARRRSRIQLMSPYPDSDATSPEPMSEQEDEVASPAAVSVVEYARTESASDRSVPLTLDEAMAKVFDDFLNQDMFDN